MPDAPFVAYNRAVLVAKARSALAYYDYLESRVDLRNARLKAKYAALCAARRTSPIGVLRRVLRYVFVWCELSDVASYDAVSRRRDKAVRGYFRSWYHMQNVADAMRQLRLLVAKDAEWETATLSARTAAVVETYCTLHIPTSTSNITEAYSGYGF